MWEKRIYINCDELHVISLRYAHIQMGGVDYILLYIIYIVIVFDKGGEGGGVEGCTLFWGRHEIRKK